MDIFLLLILLAEVTYCQKLPRSTTVSLCTCRDACNATVASGQNWEDVAFRKQVEVSSRFADQSIEPSEICDLTTGTQANPWQSHAADPTPWLILDLQAEYTIGKLVLTRRNSQVDDAQAIQSTTIALDGQRCYAFPDYPAAGGKGTGDWTNNCM
ncbi:uncharacterized protein [Littorina saxatilis]|uniref:uncharacterized protein n=1 Tax=Littorina saxatilis TaxID=31220 RepID=UPI0038B64F48